MNIWEYTGLYIMNIILYDSRFHSLSIFGSPNPFLKHKKSVLPKPHKFWDSPAGVPPPNPPRDCQSWYVSQRDLGHGTALPPVLSKNVSIYLPSDEVPMGTGIEKTDVE